MAQSKKTQGKNGNDKKVTATRNKWTIPVAAASVVVVLLVVVIVLISRGFGGNDSTGSGSQAYALTGQDLVIPISEITETAKFYPADIDGTRLEVIAVKAPDGTIRTAFNTCQVCYDSGRGYYKQKDNVLVCQNCGNQFPMSRVEVEAGGCNPWPIFAEDKIVTDESITISYDFLKESKRIFSNLKGSY